MIDPTIRSVLEHAVLAPSSHNTQPWLFAIRPEGIALHADRTRALPVNDPHDRELTASCGAALLHLRVGAAAAGRGVHVRLRPEPEDPDLLALAAWCDDPPDPSLAALASAVPARHTTREAFVDAPVSPDVVASLVAACEAEGARCLVVGADLRGAVAELVAEGDRAQFSDPRWRRELAAWMHPRRQGDGLSVPFGALTATKLVVRSFDLGEPTGTKDHALALGAPLLVLIATRGDDVEDWLTAGQALGRALLVGAASGLSAGYANQPCQVASLRPRLAALFGEGVVPQVVVRFGLTPGPEARSRRRPVDDVIV